MFQHALFELKNYKGLAVNNYNCISVKVTQYLKSLIRNCYSLKKDRPPQIVFFLSKDKNSSWPVMLTSIQVSVEILFLQGYREYRIACREKN